MNKTMLCLIIFLLAATLVLADDVLLVTPQKAGQKAAASLLIKYKTIIGQPDFQDDLRRINIQRQSLSSTVSFQTQTTNIRKDPNVAWVQPNQWRYALTEKVVPNDIYYRPERNDRQYQQWYLFMINANYAWSVSKGRQDFIVAVIDSGIDLNHPDLKARLLPGKSIVNQEDYTSPPDGMDDNGHGTHIAGLIAALSNNEIGISGCGWEGKLLPVKVLSAKGEGTDADIAEGIIWAADQGSRIINMSLGGAGEDSTIPQVLQDAIDYAHNKGCLIIAASGNSGDQSIMYPAALDHVVSVAAINPWNERAVYSTYNSYVDLAAPGGAGGKRFNRSTGMISTYWTNNSAIVDIMSGPEAGEYAITAGTSMAAALVSGAALVLWSKDPVLTPIDIENKLKSTAVDIGVSGSDQETGSGRIDLLAALGNQTPQIPLLTLYNYPNPFNPDKDSKTQIIFFLNEPIGCTINLYDVARDLVWHKKLAANETMAGKNYLTWDGKNNYGDIVANGSYLIHLTTDNGEKSKVKFISVIR